MRRGPAAPPHSEPNSAPGAGQFGVAAGQRLEACTAVIDSGRLEGKSLSSALSDRGDANLDLRNDQRALADFTEARNGEMGGRDDFYAAVKEARAGPGL